MGYGAIEVMFLSGSILMLFLVLMIMSALADIFRQ